MTPSPQYRMQRRGAHGTWRTIAHSPDGKNLIATVRPGQRLRILDPDGHITKEWTA